MLKEDYEGSMSTLGQPFEMSKPNKKNVKSVKMTPMIQPVKREI